MAGAAPLELVGSSTMPRTASGTFAFEPEHIHAMHKAFDAVCARLELSTGTGDHVMELVGLRIIELAMAGNATRIGLPPEPWRSSGSGTMDRCGGTKWPRAPDAVRKSRGRTFDESAPAHQQGPIP